MILLDEPVGRIRGFAVVVRIGSGVHVVAFRNRPAVGMAKVVTDSGGARCAMTGRNASVNAWLDGSP